MFFLSVIILLIDIILVIENSLTVVPINSVIYDFNQYFYFYCKCKINDK